jgi:hypothetical protein
MLGYAIGLLLPRLGLVRPEGIAPLSDDRIAVSLLCIIAMSLLMGAIGLLLSTTSRTTLSARIGVILTTVFFYVHWKAAAPFDTTAFDVIAASDYNVLLKIAFETVAWAKLFVATITHFVNPFVLLTYYFGVPTTPGEARALMQSDAMMTAFLATPVLVFLLAVAMSWLAHRQLVRKFHFLP